jgi:transposase-like protein
VPSISSIASQRGCDPALDRDTDVIKDDPEVLPMFEKAMQIKPGPKPELLDSSFDIIKGTNASTGTSKAYTLTRLQKDNPEEEAKKASRSARAAEMVKAGTHTQAEAARELGVSKQAVNKAISQPNDRLPAQRLTQRKPPQPTIKLADPHRTAANIHAKNQKVKMTL